MKKSLASLVLTCACLAATLQSKAGSNAYIYIQGDKQTPFYVKCEGKMMPRYGKNYCIVPALSGGNTHIEILFQQNVYPAQSFTINVPENGHRGLLLSRQNGVLKLYDLDTQKYIDTEKK